MNYYNENDPRAAAWLRSLIDAKLIPAGQVDTRSIVEIQPHELTGYTQHHFFAGIGGWPLALSLARWPEDRPVWTGSCPCQPFSDAGNGKGEADERHLWPALFRLIRELRPDEILGEQVASKAALAWFDGVSADLETEGYAAGAFDLCSAGVGAPNIRQRLYWSAVNTRPGGIAWIGYANSERLEQHEEWDGQQERSELQASRRNDTGGPCQPHGMDDTAGSRLVRPFRRAEGEARDQARVRLPSTGCEEDRAGVALGDTSGQGLPLGSQREGRIAMGNEGTASVAPGAMDRNYWSDFELIYCRDGKIRRIEPGLEPMVAGLSGRVAILRGFGNAINPQIAAEFIKAYLEVTATKPTS